MSKQKDTSQRPAYWHETQHSMMRRNDNIDYHRGGTAYMITLHIEERRPLLATMPPLCDATSRSIEAGDALALRPALKPLGEAMLQAWLTLPERFPEITIRDRADEWVIMPEHFHGILFVTENMVQHLSDVEKLFKQRVMMAYRQLLIEGRQRQPQEAGLPLCGGL